MSRIALVVLSLVFLAACQPATTELTEEHKATIIEEVTSLNSDWLSALEAADFERALTYSHQGPDVAWGFEGEIVFGFDAIASAWQPFFDSIESQDFTVQELRVEVLAPTVACINQIVTGTTTDTAGVTGPELRYGVTTVWSLREGEWKMYFGHESLPGPEPESM